MNDSTFVEPYKVWLLLVGLLIHIPLAVELLFRVTRKGLLLFYLGRGSANPVWRRFASAVDTVSLLVSSPRSTRPLQV